MKGEAQDNSELGREVLEPPVDDALLTRIAGRIRQHLTDCCIVLFGSHACGQARDDSDVDLLVLAESEDDPVAVAGQLYWVLRPRRVPIDILVMRPAEFQRRLNGFDPLVREIATHGRVLHGQLP